jgi:5'-3' exonuclease
MEVFLVDGTYELFRHYYAVPSARDKQGREVGAVRAVLASVLGMIQTAGVPRSCLAVCARQSLP